MMYDLSLLKTYSKGDVDFELDMIQTFLDEAPVYSSEMATFLNEKKIKEAGLLAHKFKSSVDIFGMSDLRLLLDDLEKNCSKNIPSEELMFKISLMVEELILIMQDKKTRCNK